MFSLVCSGGIRYPILLAVKIELETGSGNNVPGQATAPRLLDVPLEAARTVVKGEAVGGAEEQGVCAVLLFVTANGHDGGVTAVFPIPPLSTYNIQHHLYVGRLHEGQVGGQDEHATGPARHG